MKLFIPCCLLATLISSCMSVLIPIPSGNYWFMQPTKIELFEEAWERCNEMDGKLAEIHTKDELEAAMEALQFYASNQGYGSVWTGAVKNMTAGTKEHSYYWNSSLTEVNFDILKLSDKHSTCTESECTLILYSDGKVWPKPNKVGIKATALCKLRTLNRPNNEYQLLEQQLKNEAKIRAESVNELDVQIKKEAQVREKSINALKVQMNKHMANDESSESNVTSLK